MKNKFLIIVLSVTVVAGVVAAYYLRPQGPVTIENILPEGALIYIYQKDLAQLTTNFENSAFGKEISQINIPELMRKEHFDEKKVRTYERFTEQFTATVHNPVFQKILGQELALVVYPFEMQGYDLKALLDVITHLTVVVRLDKETEFLEQINRTFKMAGQEFVSEQTKYKNFPVTQATVPQLAAFNFKVTYAKIGSYLVLSFGEQNVYNAIDTFKKRKTALAKDKNYEFLKGKFIDRAQTVTYFQLEGLMALLKNQIVSSAKSKTGVSAQGKEMDKVLAELAGFKGLSYSAVYSPFVQTKFSFSYNKEQMEPLVKDFYACQVVSNGNIRFIPANILMYQWNNCYDLKAYWDNFKSEISKLPPDALKEGPAPDDIVAGIEKLIKLNIEKDILPVLGKELGWVLADVESSGAFPIPKGLFFIKVKDRVKAQSVMTTLLDQPVLFVQDEDYKGIKISFVSTPISVDVQPAYCFLDDYLLIASSRKLLHESIDASQDVNLALSNDANFKSLGFDVVSPGNGLFYIHMDALAAKVEKVIEWGSDWLMAKSREVEAYKTGSQKRLADLDADMDKTTADIKAIEDQVASLMKDREEAVNQTADTATVDGQIETAKAQLSSKQKMAQLNQEKREELQGIIESLGREKSLDPEDLKFYLDKLVYPALKALKTISVFGSDMDIGENYFDSTAVLKTP